MVTRAIRVSRRLAAEAFAVRSVGAVPDVNY
jgi:hypothetical protein